MKVKPSNRAKELLAEWIQLNPQYSKLCQGVPAYYKIHEDLYSEAVQSLVSFLRERKLTLIDCNIELNKESSRSTYLSIFISMLVSWGFGFVGGCIQGLIGLQYIAFFTLLIWVIIYYIIKTIYDVSKQHLHETYFLQVSLQEYIALYGDEILVQNKFVELSNSVLVNIPTNAETIYSEQMQFSKYYRNSFIITVNDNGQKFDYVVYSNSDNCSSANFIRLCKEQMGKNWNGINKQQIVITKAHIESDT